MAQVMKAEKFPSGAATERARAHLTLLTVPQMHCGGCMRKVEAALTAVPGVESARANLSTKRVALTTKCRMRNAEPFIGALREAGFDALALAETPETGQVAADNDLLKRLGIAGFAAANIMLLSVSVWSGQSGDMPQSMQTLFHWLSALIALPAVAYAGRPFFRSARAALSARRLNMDVPISLGVILATSMSLFQTVRSTNQVYFDAAITLLFFLLIGRVLDQRMRVRAAGAAENLLGLRSPATSIVLSDGHVECIATSDVVPGQRVRVTPGERIPVDGRIVSGSTEIDRGLITGESMPQHVSVGELVHCGTINVAGPIDIEATAVAEDTLLADIARLMSTAEQARGRYVRLADRAARLYAPAVHVLGAVTFVGWLLAGRGWEAALTSAIAVLIITCPCALALAVPAVQVVATDRLFRGGIVVKAPDALERLSEIDTILFDKTGTLTLGTPSLMDADDVQPSVLSAAAALASHSRHPYSLAVSTAAREKGVAVSAACNITEVPGSGIRGTIDGVDVRLGSASFCGVDRPGLTEPTIWFKLSQSAAVPFRMHDALRSDAVATLQQLQASGYAVEILSGDSREAVARAANELNASVWRAEMKPADKIARIEALKREGRRVLMIGDGLNDAPALAAGHASLSPSTAADISQTTADVVFQGRLLAPIVDMLRVAKASQRRAIENFAIAIGYNVVFVPLAMAGRVTPLIAAIAMSASSIAVTLNALRMRSGTGSMMA
jgi:P-type Cu2+ transporter